MSVGFGATLVPNWFSFVFSYSGGGAKGGFFDAIVLVLETGFAVTAFLAIILNLILQEEVDDEIVGKTANDADAEDDKAEWDRIRRRSAVNHTPAVDEEKGTSTV